MPLRGDSRDRGGTSHWGGCREAFLAVLCWHLSCGCPAAAPSTGTQLPARQVQALFWGTLRSWFTLQWGGQRLWQTAGAWEGLWGNVLALQSAEGPAVGVVPCASTATHPVPAAASRDRGTSTAPKMGLSFSAAAVPAPVPVQQQVQWLLEQWVTCPQLWLLTRPTAEAQRASLQVPRGTAGWRGYLTSRGWPSCGQMWQKGWQRSYGKINCLLLWSPGVSKNNPKQFASYSLPITFALFQIRT